MRFVSKCTHVQNRIIFFLIICISRSIFFLLQISRFISMYYIWDFHLWTLSVQGLTYHLRLTYAHKAIVLLHTHNLCSKPSTIHRPAHISSHRPPSLCHGYQIRVRSHQNMCIAQISVWNLILYLCIYRHAILLPVYSYTRWWQSVHSDYNLKNP